jgi:prevent-host-death family protein
MRKVGSREFKNRIAAYMDEVHRGDSLLVTKRGKPLVRVLPPVPANDDEPTLVDVLKRLEVEGHIRLAKGRLGKFRPVKIRGKSASQTLLEDRR